MDRLHREPRTFCSDPNQFGKSEHVAFEEHPFPDPNETMPARDRFELASLAGEARAAAVQHEVSLAINTILSIEGMTLADYGRLTGLDGRRIGFLLNGRLRMYVHELEQAKFALPGLEVLLAVRARRARLAQTDLEELGAPLRGYKYIAYPVEKRSEVDAN